MSSYHACQFFDLPGLFFCWFLHCCRYCLLSDFQGRQIQTYNQFFKYVCVISDSWVTVWPPSKNHNFAFICIPLQLITPKPCIKQKNSPKVGTSLALKLQCGVTSISLQCIPWLQAGIYVTHFSLRFLGCFSIWPHKWKHQKIIFNTFHDDNDSCVIAKFGESLHLQS